MPALRLNLPGFLINKEKTIIEGKTPKQSKTENKSTFLNRFNFMTNPRIRDLL